MSDALPRVLNYGGGTNSTALLIEAVKRGFTPDAVVFAFTGSEHPATYYEDPVLAQRLGLPSPPGGYLVWHAQPWAERHGLRIEIVRWIRKRNDSRSVALGDVRGKFVPLHTWCEKLHSVPSKAYGLDGCSSKWKRQVIDSWVRSNFPYGCERWVGYDAGEDQRATTLVSRNNALDNSGWVWRAPLIEWDLDRDDCADTIQAAGLPPAGKSACWLCPSTKKHELVALRRDYPALFDSALAIERQAIASGRLGVGGTIRGLGGSLNWNEWAATGRGNDPTALPCDCYDGDETGATDDHEESDR